MWNLVASKTREGQVYRWLLDKLPEMRDSLADVLALSASYLLAERQCYVRVCSQLRPSRSRPD